MDGKGLWFFRESVLTSVIVLPLLNSIVFLLSWHSILFRKLSSPNSEVKLLAHFITEVTLSLKRETTLPLKSFFLTEE